MSDRKSWAELILAINASLKAHPGFRWRSVRAYGLLLGFSICHRRCAFTVGHSLAMML
jgi:hypothetical protein